MRIFRLLWLAPGSSALSMSKVCDRVCKLLASSVDHRQNRRRPPSDSVCRAGMSRLPRSLETNRLVTTTQPSAAPVTSPCTEYVPSLACVGGHGRREEPEFASLLRSDTLTQHQFDPPLRSSFIPTRCRNDDTNRVNIAARTAWVDVTGAVYCQARGRSGQAHHGIV